MKNSIYYAVAEKLDQVPAPPFRTDLARHDGDMEEYYTLIHIVENQNEYCREKLGRLVIAQVEKILGAEKGQIQWKVV